MNSKDCLNHICDECQKNAGKIQVACPFRSISNEYCDEYETIKKDLDRLEQLEKENQELKQLVKEQFEKIQRDSGKMASMDCELRRLKGEFIPQECEG